MRSGIEPTARGTALCLDPEIGRSIVDAITETLAPMLERGSSPIILTSASVRRFVRLLIQTDLPSVGVLSFEELPMDLDVHPIGRAVI